MNIPGLGETNTTVNFGDSPGVGRAQMPSFNFMQNNPDHVFQSMQDKLQARLGGVAADVAQGQQPTKTDIQAYKQGGGF